MDPTEIPQVAKDDGTQRAIPSQGVLLGQHDQLIRTLLENSHSSHTQVTQLTTQVAKLSVFPSPSLPAPPVSPSVPTGMATTSPLCEPPINSAEPFSGELKCQGISPPVWADFPTTTAVFFLRVIQGTLCPGVTQRQSPCLGRSWVC